jgi:3-dehydroquinate synthase
LLATVDSSIGGKTGINLKEGKNLAGAFYQPQAVICDLSLLDTLPDEVFKDGYAEIVKYGILSGNQLFNRIKKPLKSDIESIVYECVKIKRDIVQKDESDIGMRQLLNLGHTIAHAVELLSGYTISHGAAVAKGLHLISKISYTQGLCTKEVLTKITDMLNLHGFNTDLLYGAKDIANAITADKKRSSGHINLILIRDIGKCTIEKTDMSDLTDIIQTATEYRG